MSIPYKTDSEVVHRLEKQRRRAALGSVVIAMLSVSLIGLVLALMLIPTLMKESPNLVAYVLPASTDTPDPEQRQFSSQQRPSPPASSPQTRVITSRSFVPIALEIPEVSEVSSDMGFFHDDFDYGSGWQGTGDGSGSGGGGFGSTSRASGGLEGWMYDFKKTPAGEPVKYDLASASEFVDRVVRLQRSRFSDSALSRYFRAPNNLFLTHLAIPLSPAEQGPEFFGAKESIAPSGWIACYRGTVIVPQTGVYRFSGLGDDYLAVFLDGRMRLAACWGDIQPAVEGRWKPTEPTGSFKSNFSAMRLVYGDWVRLTAGQRVEINIVIGERPGGKVGFVLHLEEKSVEYRKAADGRPILPLFTTMPLPEKEMERLRKGFGSYEIDWEHTLVFPAG